MVVYSTDDGGLNWDFVDIPNNFVPRAITKIGEYIIVTGDDGLIMFNRIPCSINENIIVSDFNLFQNYPNPFNPTTTIKYTIPHVETRHASSLQNVTLKVYDVLGNEIITLVNKERTAGEYEVKLDGSKLSCGIYFYRLQTGSFSEVGKMILMK